MSSIDLYQKLRTLQKGVFTLKDISLITSQNTKSATVTANRLVKKNILSKIERVKFCLKGEDSKVIACQIVKPSYISFFSAIYFHGGTTQIPIELQVACLKNRRPINYDNDKISFHRMKPHEFTGFEVERNHDGKQYAIASKEKAIADSIAYSLLCPLDEVKEAVKRFKDLDYSLCRKYVKLFHNKQAEFRLEKVLSE